MYERDEDGEGRRDFSQQEEEQKGDEGCLKGKMEHKGVVTGRGKID